MIDEEIPTPVNDCPNCGGLGVVYDDMDNVYNCLFCSLDYENEEFEEDDRFDDEFDYY